MGSVFFSVETVDTGRECGFFCFYWHDALSIYRDCGFSCVFVYFWGTTKDGMWFLAFLGRARSVEIVVFCN